MPAGRRSSRRRPKRTPRGQRQRRGRAGARGEGPPPDAVRAAAAPSPPDRADPCARPLADTPRGTARGADARDAHRPRAPPVRTPPGTWRRCSSRRRTSTRRRTRGSSRPPRRSSWWRSSCRRRYCAGLTSKPVRSPASTRGIHRSCSLDRSPAEAEALRAVVGEPRRSVMVTTATASGKSRVYAAPLLQRPDGRTRDDFSGHRPVCEWSVMGELLRTIMSLIVLFNA